MIHPPKSFLKQCLYNQQLDKFTWGFGVFRLSAVLKKEISLPLRN